MTDSEARFTINAREGIVELEGKETFVEKHLGILEGLLKLAIKEAMSRSIEQTPLPHNDLTSLRLASPSRPETMTENSVNDLRSPPLRRAPKLSVAIAPVAVDLKMNDSKPGLREFYAEKNPANHYEKTAVFAYYLTKFNKHTEIKFGEILTCYEEISEKKPSIIDIVKNSVRYKGWLENSSEKLSCRLTISGENFVKFDLPSQKKNLPIQETIL